MDREEAKNVAANINMIKAFADGKRVEHNPHPERFGSNWTVGTSYSFTEDPSHYRIKPEPVEVEVWYRALFGKVEIHPIANLVAPDKRIEAEGFRKIRMREVI